jgi:hypothetical protein
MALNSGYEELVACLRTLARDSADPAERETAARTLLVHLKQWAAADALRRNTYLRRTASDGGLATLLEDAVQHVAVAACTGAARFRGSTPGEAVTWCRKVLDNHLRSELRRQSRRDSVTRALGPSEAAAPSTRDRTLTLQEFDNSVLEYLRRTRRPKDAATLYRSVCCYFEHLAGVPLHAQVERWADAADSNAVERARNRIYRYHHRGRRVLAELLSSRPGSARS